MGIKQEARAYRATARSLESILRGIGGELGGKPHPNTMVRMLQATPPNILAELTTVVVYPVLRLYGLPAKEITTIFESEVEYWR